MTGPVPQRGVRLEGDTVLVTTIVVDAHQTMGDAAVRIEGMPDQAYVVVRRREGLDIYWYAFRAAFLREMAERAPDGPVVEVLNLREGGASPTHQLDESPTTDGRVGIVLDGDRAIGVIDDSATSASRGGGTTAASPPGNVLAPPPAPSPFEEQPTRSAPPEAERGGAGGSASEQDAEVDTEAARFTAFPELTCPNQVAVGETFDLVVKLAAEERPETGGGAVTVATDLPAFDLVVQLVAAGFAADRIRDVLHVDRSDLPANEARFSLTAEPFDGSLRPAVLQIDFSFGGLLCGRAWRAVVVTSGAAAPEAAASPAPLAASTPVVVANSERAPDLVVTITENDDGTQLDWRFTTPHEGVTIPDGPILRRFKAHNAQSFAMQQIRVAHMSIGAAAVGNRMLGIARTIADEVPPEAWQVLGEVWAAAKAKGELPAVLLVSSDPYIPWELASTEAAYVDGNVVDAALPPILGAQVRISRWTAPQPRGAGAVLNPPLPPPERVEVERMALVVGDYLAVSGQRPLPKALEEGNMLAARYRAIRLTATLDEIDPLFDGTLDHDGQRFDPDVVHFACHGQIDPNPAFNGIVLNEGNVRLDVLYVAGNRMQRPFVFLNACQIGQATELLGDAGGLAAGFLKTGASGFVAPLWNVDDQLAQDTALAFYAEALDQGESIAEVLRRRRAQFDLDATSPQMTHLAYVYYGHPNLLLSTTG